MGFSCGSAGKTLSAVQEIQERRVWSLGREDSLDGGMASHSSILAWRIPWTREPGSLESMSSQSQSRLKRLTRLHNGISSILLKSSVLPGQILKWRAFLLFLVITDVFPLLSKILLLYLYVHIKIFKPRKMLFYKTELIFHSQESTCNFLPRSIYS